MISLDTETFRTQPGLLAPPLVCTSWATREASGLLHHTESYEYVKYWIEHEHIVGANIAFDMGVFCAKWPELIPLVFDAYDNGRIKCVIVRQKLIDIGHGMYRGFWDEKNKFQSVEYNLEDLARRYSPELGLLEKLSGQKMPLDLDKGDDGWRLRFGELYNVPLDQWPERAKTYALGDAKWPVVIHDGQEKERSNGFLEDECRQAAADFVLQLMSIWGTKTDPVWVDRLEKTTNRIADELRTRLMSYGLVETVKATKTKPAKTKRNTKTAKQRMAEVCLALGIKTKLTEKGQICLDEDACTATADPILIDYAQYSSLSTVVSKDIPTLRAGTQFPIQPRYEVLLETGRTSASGDKKKANVERSRYGYNVQNIRRLPGIRECFVPRPGFYFADADYDGLELRTVAQVCLLTVGFSRLAESLNKGLDAHLDLATEIIAAEGGGDISYQFAQEAIEGRHGEEWKKKLEDARQMSKVANFGLAGGLSAAGRDGQGGLREYARVMFQIKMTIAEADKLRANWFKKWPEFVQYFQWLKSLQNHHGEINLVHFFSNRHRGRCTFTVAANGLFQSLGADAAKAALFAVSKACYSEVACYGCGGKGSDCCLGRGISAMYGSRPSLFIHDQIISEVPIPIAHEAAIEKGRIMCVEGSKFLPDVPLTTTPCLAMRYSKKAKAVYDQNKRLIPWDIGIDDIKALAA